MGRGSTALVAFSFIALAACAGAQSPAAGARRLSRAERDSVARVERQRSDSIAKARADSIARLQFRADTASLHRRLDSLAGAFHGVLGYSVRNLETGESLQLRGDETFPTASLIKVSILVALYDRVEKKELSLDDRIIVLKADKVPGSGILQFLHDGNEITLGDAAWLMITLSDNTATNLVLDKVPMRRVWQKMEALGLPHTKVHSKSFMRITSVAIDSSARYGLGVTTPNEMARLYELLANGQAVSPAADSAMLWTMRHTSDDDLLQRQAGAVRAAFKTGANSDMRTECTLWWLPARVIACVLTRENVDQRWTKDNEAEVTMARMGEAIVTAWRPPPR